MFKFKTQGYLIV